MKNSYPKKIRKAVIPAAGLGTRFLPATKSIPKEMLTVVDSPVILYVVEEAVAAGIEDIILIQGRGKTAIEDFFDVSYELEDKLAKSGKQDIIDRLNKIKNMANIISIRQKQAKGLGHAVMTAMPAIGSQPFAVLLGDEIMVPNDPESPVIGSLVQAFEETQTSTVAVMQVEQKEVFKYGIAELKKYLGQPLTSFTNEEIFQIVRMIEKPAPGETDSRWALPGRYTFTNEIMNHLKETKPGKNGEIQLTDAMASLQAEKGMFALPIDCHRYDAGDVLGFLKANIEMSLRRPDHHAEVKKYLNEFFIRGKAEGLL